MCVVSACNRCVTQAVHFAFRQSLRMSEVFAIKSNMGRADLYHTKLVHEFISVKIYV